MKAREAAFRVVHEVLYKEGWSNVALEEMLGRFDTRDSGFITQIVLGTLRNKLLLEYSIAGYSKTRVNKISPSVMSAMLTGAYQILFMDRTPDSAACNEAVKLASKYAGYRTKGFVNAILRKISTEKEKVFKRIEDADITIRFSINADAVGKLISQYGKEKTETLLANLNKPARPCIRFNDSHNDTVHNKILSNEGIDFKQGNIVPTAYYPEISGPVSNLDLYGEGLVSLQDEGAQAMGLFASPSPGSAVLDACASPGGKTAHMAALMEGKGTITACDIHSRRVENMKENLARTGFRNIRFMEMDMSVVHDEFIDKFDTVLADVPCSGLGTAQRRPEIKLFYKEDPDLYKLQGDILESCAKYVKPGGHLIYGTCTLLREENREAVDRFLSKNTGFSLAAEKTILPDGSAGGFYMARLKRGS